MSVADNEMIACDRPGLARVLAALVVFGVAFGYLEAAVVVYLRALYDPIRQEVTPDREPGELFPMLRQDQLEAEGPEYMRLLKAELGREAATLVMLAAVALVVARNARQWLAAFVIAFGVWDIFYYVSLRMLLGWPDSLLTWDILFLLPVPWVGPVLAPVLVSLSMIIAGVIVLWQEQSGTPFRLAPLHWMLLVTGGLVLVTSFCWDFKTTSAGLAPNPFNWPLFALGEVVGLGAFGHALWTSRGSPSVAAG